MKRTFAGSIVLFLAATLAAQTLPSVDVDTANMQIEQFENENRSLEERIQLLTASVDGLEADVETWTRWANGIERVSKLLDERAERLLDVLGEIGSRSIVDRAESVLERYSRMKLLLEAKHEDLRNRIEDAQGLLADNRATIAEYESRIEQNKKNIELLKAAIANSVSSESLMKNYLEGLETLLDDALDLLSESRDEEPTP